MVHSLRAWFTPCVFTGRLEEAASGLRGHVPRLCARDLRLLWRFAFCFVSQWSALTTPSCFFLFWGKPSHQATSAVPVWAWKRCRTNELSCSNVCNGGAVLACTAVHSGAVLACTNSGGMLACTNSGAVLACTYSGAVLACTNSGAVLACTYSGAVLACTAVPHRLSLPNSNI
jgi:hypothetical protein